MTAHCIDTLPPEQTGPAAWRCTDFVADRTWMQALDQADLAELNAALQAFLAQPGNLQFVHNYVLLHDRTGFTDFDAPARTRHLLRLWLAASGARELSPGFAARDGALTVGDRGGVVVPNMRLTVPLLPAGR